jgi:oxalate decarboxylase
MGEAYFAGGPFLMTTPQPKPTLATTHRYQLGAQQSRRVPGGGAQWTVTANEFPILTTLSASVLEIEPGAMRELHWHPQPSQTRPCSRETCHHVSARTGSSKQ